MLPETADDYSGWIPFQFSGEVDANSGLHLGQDCSLSTSSNIGKDSSIEDSLGLEPKINSVDAFKAHGEFSDVPDLSDLLGNGEHADFPFGDDLFADMENQHHYGPDTAYGGSSNINSHLSIPEYIQCSNLDATPIIEEKKLINDVAVSDHLSSHFGPSSSHTYPDMEVPNKAVGQGEEALVSQSTVRKVDTQNEPLEKSASESVGLSNQPSPNITSKQSVTGSPSFQDGRLASTHLRGITKLNPITHPAHTKTFDLTGRSHSTPGFRHQQLARQPSQLRNEYHPQPMVPSHTFQHYGEVNPILRQHNLHFQESYPPASVNQTSCVQQPPYYRDPSSDSHNYLTFPSHTNGQIHSYPFNMSSDIPDQSRMASRKRERSPSSSLKQVKQEVVQHRAVCILQVASSSKIIKGCIL